MSGLPRIERYGEKACRVITGQAVIFFSYETCVAIGLLEDGNALEAVRIAAPSATSERHMAMMGCQNFRQVSPGEFNKIASGI